MANLDRLFHALADPTRRAVVERLQQGGALPVGALAAPAGMALPSFLKHLRVLEDAGVIETEKAGRVRLCRLSEGALAPVEGWLADQRSLWEGRTERLAALVERQQESKR